MRTLFKIIAILIVIILVVSSIYAVFYFNEENNSKDTTPPAINSITGNTTGTTGKITTILVSFSDNVNVTEATIYYKSKSAQEWSSESILSGRADITIPSDSNEDWYYYVTVNDAAGNGPVGDPSTDGSIFYTITVTENLENLVHYVFIEEATATWCKNCPDIAGALHDFYNSGEHNFYYVSMIDDKSTKADDRLKEYNIYGYPTVFIDGGYNVLVGGDKGAQISEALGVAEMRSVPQIKVTANAKYNNDTGEITTDVLVESNESSTYTGTLKVYLTEINSRWVNNNLDSNGEIQPYHFGFIDYIINEDISVKGKGSTTRSDISNISKFATDLDPENIMIIAVVFNSESVTQYSNPPNGNSFEAHYADATDAIELIQGGDLPPTVGITLPEAGKLHILGTPIFKNHTFKKTILIGKTTVSVNAQDDTGIAKVEFYIDGKLKNTDDQAPYEWSFRKVKLLKRIVRKHTITVKAYDLGGKTAEASLDCICFFL